MHVFVLCLNYTEKKKRISIETLYKLKRFEGEDILSFCKRMNLSNYIYSIMIFDYIICNQDRHGANIEFLMDSNIIIPTPIFDNGVCLMFSCRTEKETRMKKQIFRMLWI